MAEPTWVQFKDENKKYGKSWNLFIKEVLKLWSKHEK